MTASDLVAEPVGILARFFTILHQLSLVAIAMTSRPRFDQPLCRTVRCSTALDARSIIARSESSTCTMLAARSISLTGADAPRRTDLIAQGRAGARWPVLVDLLAATAGLQLDRDPCWWSLFPIVYLCLRARGARAIERRCYPYPFIDVGKIGYPQTACSNACDDRRRVRSSAGLVLVWLDRRLLGRRRCECLRRAQ